MSNIDRLKARANKIRELTPNNYEYGHIYIDRSLYEKLREECQMDGLTVKDVVSALVADYIGVDYNHTGRVMKK